MNSKIKCNRYEKYKPSRSQYSFQNSTNKYESFNHYERYKSLRAQHSFQNSTNNYDGKYKYQIMRSSNSRKHPYEKKYAFSKSDNLKNNCSIKNVPDKALTTVKSSTEDEEEENRKKKLSDLANKLLNKIKTWNAASDLQNDLNKSMTVFNPTKSSDENIKDKKFESSDSNVNNLSDNTFSGTSNEGKTKRISHSLNNKKECSIKKLDSKKFDTDTDTGKFKKSVKKSNVNKLEVEKLQNKIQHKLINQIMHMPKKNLENMLNDPKINPIMAAKISVLVKENKLLLAQKLRVLAESKIMPSSCSNRGELLIDIDKIIEPVVETDLSLLPDQLIKEMENIFQVQFHSSSKKIIKKSVINESESQAVFQNFNLHCNDTLGNLTNSDEEINIDALSKNVKLENFVDNENVNCNDACKSITSSDEKVISDNFNEDVRIEIHSDDANMDCNDGPDGITNFDKKVNTDSLCDDIKTGTFFDNENTNENDHQSINCNNIPESIISFDKKVSTDILYKNIKIETQFDDKNIDINDPEKIQYHNTPMNVTSSDGNNTDPCYKNIKIETHLNYENVNVNDGENIDLKFNSNIPQNNCFLKHSESSKKIWEGNLKNLNEKSLHCGILSRDLHNYEFLAEQDKNQNVKLEPITPVLPMDFCTSKGCQTEISCQTTATQTQLHSKELNDLLEIDLLPSFERNNRTYLLEEINFIQILINKLNERRLKIFLELAKTKEEDRFVPDQLASISLMETISNGNIHIINFLKRFFSSTV